MTGILQTLRIERTADQAHAAVAVVGLGYVGLPTALALAETGRSVVGFDISESRLADIKAGSVDLIPIDHLRLARHLGTQQLELTTEANAIMAAHAVIICVPTPVDSHFVPDLTALTSACATVAASAVAGQTIVLTSTTYVGSTHDLLVALLEKRGLRVGVDVFVAFSPERIDPGNANHRQEHTPRVVGGVTQECTRRAVALLSDCAPVIHTVSSPGAAELTKLLENTFRAVNIALANEFSTVARELQLDVMEIIHAAATKPYGFMPFYPGPGVGGHCISSDPHYLLWQLKSRRVGSPVIEAAMTANACRPRQVVTRAEQLLAQTSRPVFGSRILMVGITYKPGVADIRESPALEIINWLQAAGADVGYTDPHVERVSTSLRVLHNEPATAMSWDLVIMHTRHPSVDHTWLDNAPLVLDTSYRLAPSNNCHAL